MITVSKKPQTEKQKVAAKAMGSAAILHITLAITSFISVAIIGPLLILGIYYLSTVMSGIKIGDPTTTFQASQILLWFTLLGLVVLVLLVKLLHKRRNYFLKCSRNLFYLFVPLVLIGTSISFVVQSVKAGKERQAAINSACDLKSQLSKARRAVYFIGNDTGFGSAFAIDATGDLVTANHAVDGSRNLYTYVNGSDGKPQKIAVSVVRTAPAYDLALLHIDTPTTTYLTWENTADGLIGEDIYGVGFPGNEYNEGYASVTKGIVSRLIRTTDIPNAPADLSYVQTDAALNHGDSGGPLIASCGVVGITEAASDTQGLEQYGFASEQNISYGTSSDTAKKALGL